MYLQPTFSKYIKVEVEGQGKVFGIRGIPQSSDSWLYCLNTGIFAWAQTGQKFRMEVPRILRLAYALKAEEFVIYHEEQASTQMYPVFEFQDGSFRLAMLFAEGARLRVPDLPDLIALSS